MPFGPMMGARAAAAAAKAKAKRKKRVDPTVRQYPPYRDFEDGSLDEKPKPKKPKKDLAKAEKQVYPPRRRRAR